MNKDYTSMARARIHRAGELDRQPRILVYGRNKRGKTRFSSTAPDVLILDPEEGTTAETKLKPDVWPVVEWQDIVDAYTALKGGMVSPTTGRPYKWVALDGMTRILSIAINFVSRKQAERDLSRQPDQVDQRTYGQANKMMEGMLHNFHSLHRVGIIMTAQERVVEIKEMEDLEGDDDAVPAGYMYVPDLTAGSRAPLNQIVDLIGRIYIVRGEFEVEKRVRVGGVVKTKMVPQRIQRRLWVGPHQLYDTGARSEIELPDFISNPTVLGVVEAIKKGK
jgi:hypothetical protein